MARKKGGEVAEATPKTTKTRTTHKAVEQVYGQLSGLLKKNKVSKRDIASHLGMSYQGFLNSFNKRNLKLDAWFETSDYLNMPFVSRFESAKQAAQAEKIEGLASASASGATEDFNKLHLDNANQKIAILEKQIASLESQIQDKQTIIELISGRK